MAGYFTRTTREGNPEEARFFWEMLWWYYSGDWTWERNAETEMFFWK